MAEKDCENKTVPENAAGGEPGLRPAPASSWPAAIVETADAAVFGQTLDGTITSWNPRAELLFGHRAAEIVGRSSRALLPPGLEDEEAAVVARLAGGARGEHLETVRLARDGSLIDVSLTLSPIADAAGAVVGVSQIARDISGGKTRERDFLRYEKQLRLITDALPVLISFIDRERRYRFVNRGYTEWFGVEPEQMIGAHMSEVLGAKAYGEVRPMIERALAGERVSFDHVIETLDGERFVHVNYSPDVDPATGAIGGFYSLVNDVSENRRVEARLRRSEERLRIATEAAEIFAWEVDFATGVAQWSENAARIVGAGDERDADPLFFVLPEERARLTRDFESGLEAGADGFEAEFRGLNLHGEERVWRSQSTLIRDRRGRPQRSVGITQDITEERRREADRQFLHELGELIRDERLTGEALLDEVTARTCRHLGAARCLFTEIDEAADRGLIRHEYVKPGLGTVAGEYKISAYSPATLAEIRRGQTIVNCDAARDPRTAAIFERTYAPYDERAYLSMALFTGGQWTAIFWISDDRPRRWTPNEIALFEAVGERAWLAVEKMRSEEELRKHRGHLQMAMNAAEICSWEIDLADGRIEWSDNAAAVIGFALPPQFDALLDGLLHPEDRDAARAAYADWAAERAAAAGVELRLVDPADGREVWVYAQGVPVEGHQGRRARLVGIWQNITGRKNVQHQLEDILRREQAARREAEEMNRLKDEFLTTVSHELRTPLNSILGWSQMLSAGRLGEDQRQAALASIHRNAKTQARLIEDLLDTSRIITGKLRLEIVPTALAPLIEATVESLRPALAAKDLRLELALDAGFQMVDGDPTRLQQIVWNLLSNAIKFTPEGGRVAISLDGDERQTRVTVADTGAGMTAEFLPFVFERFRQADGSSTRQHGGLGLGLAIVRHLVELHGGTIEAESEGPGRGARFTFALPRAKVRSVERPKGKLVDWLALEAVPAVPEPEPQELSAVRVLVVDDEPDALEMLKVLLEGRGALVRTETNVAAALAALDDWRPDVIVSDIAMPEENGFGLIARLRARPPGRGGELPAVALTAYGGDKERRRILASGFQAHLAKPVEAEALVRALSRLAPKN